MVQRLLQKEWIHIAKALGNDNRLKILRILWGGDEQSVTALSQLLRISIKATSRNLVLLEKQGLISGQGKHRHVFYRIAPLMSDAVKQTLTIILTNVR